MKKIAIIMIIHEYSEYQKMLLNHLSKDFDVYVHVDKRTNINKEVIANENCFVFKEYKVFWGSFNLVLATLFLLKKASEKNLYNRFIIISGSDIPLKSNKEILDFFMNNNNEYLYYEKLPRICWSAENGGFDRIDYFWPRLLINSKATFFEKVMSKISSLLLQKCVKSFMIFFKFKRRLNCIDYYGGNEWMDLTAHCVSQILQFTENNKKFMRKFRFTNCSDEIFFHTVICNYIKNISIEKKTLRYIDWKTGPEKPRVLRLEDYDNLHCSDALFARKVNMKDSKQIIKKIFEEIENKLV